MSETELQPFRSRSGPRRDFPAFQFKRLVVLSADYRTNARFGTRGGSDTLFGMPWSIVVSLKLAPVATTMRNVLSDHLRHGITTKHFPVWLAMETGIILQQGEWHFAFADDPRLVLDDRQTARIFQIAEETARTYRNAFARALDEEWLQVTRYEDWSWDDED